MGTSHRWLWAALAIVVLTSPAVAQDLSITLSGQDSLTTRTLVLLAGITLLSLAPGLAIMVTCFPFVITVLAILRQALGLQQSPPNMLLVSLALFLTYFVMDPVFQEAWQAGLRPVSEGTIPLDEGLSLAADPFRRFMAARVDAETLLRLADLRQEAVDPAALETTPLSLLVPSFMLSEIARAFQIGFLIYLPFLVIDLVVAAVLMSMGMMMVPPVVVSLPFKLAFFVVADGWTLLSEALLRSYL